jgi:hypothetical protein
MEEWKQIENYPNFEISNRGRLKNLSKDKILNFNKPNSSGYFIHVFNREGKRTSKGIHWLVAKHFIPNPYNLPTVEHIDRDSTNNNVDNLKWASWQTQWANRDNKKGESNKLSKLTEEQVREIIQLGSKGTSQNAIANKFNISQPLVSKIIRGLSWKHL